MNDIDYLKQAIELAKQSSEEVGCACMIVQNGKIIAVEYNSQRTDQVAVHHAEVKAVYQANRKTGKRKLEGATAYCSCEPCAMCITALSYAKVARVIYRHSLSDLFPHDRQSELDIQKFIKHLNFVPEVEQIIV